MDKITADTKHGNDSHLGDQEWHGTATPWTVTLHYQGHSMAVNFWTGPALTTEPTAFDVVECLLSDALVLDCSFEEWCAECGYDTDSRKAYATYEQALAQSRRFATLLGGDPYKILDGELRHDDDGNVLVG